MNKFVILLTTCLLALSMSAQQPVSPNGKLLVTNTAKGITVYYQNNKVLDVPALGYEGFKNGKLKWKFAGMVKADYQMIAGKKSICSNEANEYKAALSSNLQLVLRLYNDGVAFRYELSGLNGKLPKELTAYQIPEGTKRWMMQWTDSYEGFFPLNTTGKIKPIGRMAGVVKSPEGYNLRWGFPTLVEPLDGVFMLLSEANIERNQAAACLYTEGELLRVTPDVNEVKLRGKWHSPWRIAIIGCMKDLIQSTLVTDVSEPCKLKDTSWIKPGVVSWIYWAYNHGSNDYNIIKKYVDMAVTLKLPYVLIDAEWDEMKDGKTIEDAVAYANSKGVKPMIWYNSSVGWIDGAPTPKFRLNKPEDREKEFAWCEKIGVAGVKIDFFSGDCQRDMTYCIDLLESAAKHHLLVNFHGATVPRGWQRTYPNLMSTEGVYGAEWYNNVPTFTKQAASHNTTLPFTRNIIGPMDYTPCTFSDSQHPHITSDAHELALTVLYESALQHLADKPESYLVQPQQVQDFFGQLPTVWDETRYVSGYPGESVVLARRSGSTWYVAGINGTDNKKTLDVDLSFIDGGDHSVQTFADADPSQVPTCWRQGLAHQLWQPDSSHDDLSASRRICAGNQIIRGKQLFPTLQLVFYLRQLTAMENGFFYALTLLCAIVVKQAECISAQQHDGDKVASREECHKEIYDIPHQLETGHGTKHHHHTCRTNAIGGHHLIVLSDKADVSLAIVVVADDAGEGKQEDGDGDKHWSNRAHLALQCTLSEGDTIEFGHLIESADEDDESSARAYQQCIGKHAKSLNKSLFHWVRNSSSSSHVRCTTLARLIAKESTLHTIHNGGTYAATCYLMYAESVLHYHTKHMWYMLYVRHNNKYSQHHIADSHHWHQHSTNLRNTLYASKHYEQSQGRQGYSHPQGRPAEGLLHGTTNGVGLDRVV